MSNFKSIRNKGFKMVFENGWTISVQFGYGNYCSHRNHENQSEVIHECPDAEIAIWDASGKWYNFGSDTVKGYCSADEVATWIKFTADQGK